MASELGRLFIVIDGAINNLKFDSDEERERFTKHLADTAYENTRHRLLTWRGNRAERKPGPITEAERRAMPPSVLQSGA